MTTNNHTPIPTLGALNASTFNSPLGELDSSIGNKSSLTTTAKGSAVAAVNELDAQIGTAASVSGSIGASIDTDGTLKAGAVDVAAVLTDGVVTAAKLDDGAAPSANLVFDPFNRYFDPVAAGNQDGKHRWYLNNSSYASRITDANNPFGQKTMRLTNIAGKRLYMSEMGLKIGDVISAAVLALVPTGTSVAVNFTYRTSAAAPISVVTGATVVGNDTTKYMVLETKTLPATCAIVDLWISYVSGSGNVDVYGWYLWNADKAFQAASTDGVGDGQRAMQQIFDTYSSTETSLAERILRINRNFLQDPFGRQFAPITNDAALQDGGRLRWFTGSQVSRLLTDTNNPFGLPTLRITPSAGRRFWIDELGVAVNDVLSFGALVRVAVGNTFTMSITFRTSGGTFISAAAGTATAGDGTVQFLTKTGVQVPATTGTIDVWFSRSVGTGTLDLYGMFGYFGSTINQVECLSQAYAERFSVGGWLQKRELRPDKAKFELMSLRNIEARIALAQAGKYGRIMAIGDSITNGSYRYLSPLVERLQINAGVGSCGAGFIGTNSATWTYSSVGAISKFTSVSRSGSWTDHTAYTSPIGHGPDMYDAESGAAADQYTITAVFTDARILYEKQVGGGTFKYRIDGGAWSSNVATNASSAFAAETITGQTPVSHTLEVYANGATVKLLGFEVYDTSLNGWTQQKLGYSGAKTADWVAISSNAIWQAAIAAMIPDLIIIWLGTNDRNGYVVDATYKANMLTLIAALRTALPTVSILLVSPYIDGQGYVNKHTFESYRDRVFDITNEVINCAAIDMGAYINYATSSTLSLWEDTVHINEYGGQIAGNVLYQALQMGRRSLNMARARRHVSLPLSEIGAGGTAPTLTRLGNTVGYAFSIGDDGYASIEVPSDWDPTTDIRITAHLYTNEAYATRSGEIRFQAAWSSISVNANTAVDAPVRSGTLTGADLNIAATAKGLQEYDFGYIPYASIVANDSIFLLISRIALVAGTNPTAEPVIVFLEYEYISNSLGIAA